MCNCQPKKYSKSRAVLDIILSLFTAGFWSIVMAYSRYNSKNNR